MRKKKKKSRWKRILLWSSLSLVVILIASLFVMDYAVDRVLRSMSGMDVILEEADVSDSTDRSPMSENKAEGTDNPAKDESANTGEAADQPDPSAQLDESGSASKGDAVANQAVESTDSKEPAYKAEVSTERAKEIEENASVSEKAIVASMLMKNLSAADIKHLKNLASGGLNLEEKKAARSLILEKLSETEYNKLIRIAQKFGVSQGKSYSEVMKEE